MDPTVVVIAVAALVVGLGLGLAVAGRRPSSGTSPVADGERAGTDRPTLGPDARMAIELMGAGVLHVDDELVVDVAGATAERLFGAHPGGLVGRTVLEVFLDRRVEELVHGASTDGATSVDLTVRGDGDRELLVRARRPPAGGTWLVVEDVSELHRLRRIRAEFIDNLSHELRTPLTNIGLLAETLARDVEAAGDAVPARMRGRVGKIEVETGHLIQMVNEMLELSRIESGGPIAHVDMVDLVALAAAATERLRVFAERQGVILEVDAPRSVPAVRGDEDRLAQVLVNLLHNAVKFSPEGGSVTVHVAERSGEIALAVEDRGVGIPAAAQARIFERFYKVDRARARGGGTGLGLSIARHIVGSHGGRIVLESQEGVGSTFTVVLPVAAGSRIPVDADDGILAADVPVTEDR